MALSFLYQLVRPVLEGVRVHRMDAVAKDAEILVLRHPLAILDRQVARSRFTWTDRALVALLAAVIPKERWAAFLVTPKMILAWHRPSSDGAGPTRTNGRGGQRFGQRRSN